MPAVASGEKENAANQTRNVMNKRGHVFELHVQDKMGASQPAGWEGLPIICGKTQVSKITRNSSIPWQLVGLLPDEGGCLTRRADVLSAKSAG